MVLQWEKVIDRNAGGVEEGPAGDAGGHDIGWGPWHQHCKR